mmetsp:Transcript_13610/g.32965  ORF Transcript_13610/g.32965 Transcript_13610/m.32965 type:complete len:204 (-) Transcript_13610:314-925(-)
MKTVPDLIIRVCWEILRRNRSNRPAIVDCGDRITSGLPADKRRLSRRHISRKDALVSILGVHPPMRIQVQMFIVGHHCVIWRSSRWWHESGHRPLPCRVFWLRIFAQLRFRHYDVERLPVIQTSYLGLCDHEAVEIGCCEQRIIVGKIIFRLDNSAALISLTLRRAVVHKLANSVVFAVSVLAPHACAMAIHIVGALVHLDHY